MFNNKALILLAFVTTLHTAPNQSSESFSDLFKNPLFFGSCAVAAIIGCYYYFQSNTIWTAGIQGSGIIKKEDRTHIIKNQTFKKISVANCIEAKIIENADDYAMTVISDDNILPCIKTEIKNDILKLYIASGSYNFTKAHVNVRIPYNITEYKASDCGKLHTSATQEVREAKNCNVHASSYGTIQFDQPQRIIDTLTAQSSDSSTISIKTYPHIKNANINGSSCGKIIVNSPILPALIDYLVINASSCSTVDLSTFSVNTSSGKITDVSTLYTGKIANNHIKKDFTSTHK